MRNRSGERSPSETHPEAGRQDCFGDVSAVFERGAGGRSRRSRAWRRWLLPLLTVAAIVAAIVYLQRGTLLPWQQGRSSATGGLRIGGVQTSGASGSFVTLESNSLKLGAGSGPKLGETAPDFTLQDLNGAPIRLSDLRGKTVVLNFWATWCLPCRREFPRLQRAYAQNAGEGLVVLAVDVQEGPAGVRSFADAFAATFPIVLDADGSVERQYRVYGLPTTWFIDGQGVVRAQQVGELTDDALVKKLAQAGFSVGGGR